MDIRVLKYFTVLVEKRGFTKAAEALHISQPSLSNSIKKLERELGWKLIDRTTREFRLTEEGAHFYRESKKLVQHYEQMEQEVKNVREKGPGVISIGLIESSMLWMPEILIEFQKLNPHTRVKLLEVLSLKEVEEALGNFEIHLAITNQIIKNEDIQTRPIYRERLIAFLPLEHPMTNQKAVQLEDLAKENLIICREGFQSREDILRAFRERGIEPNIQFEIERFETAARLVDKNLGITILPENYIHYAGLSSIAKPIADGDIERTVYLAYVKNRYLSPMVWQFFGLVNQFFNHSTKDKLDSLLK